MNDRDAPFIGVAMMISAANTHRLHRTSYVGIENGVSAYRLASSDGSVRMRRDLAALADETRSDFNEFDGDGKRIDDDEILDSYYWGSVFPDLVRESSAYWVDAEMCAVLEHAAHYLPETYVLRAEHVPAALGVVTFATPVSDGVDEWAYRVAFWHRTPSGVILYSLAADQARVAAIESWEYGRVESFWLRHMSAFWLFIQQEIPRLDQIRARRQIARHALRDAPTLHVATLTTLRRREASVLEPRPTDVDWSHRWLVSGHWRNQYFPSTGEHHPLWIAPYVKGPEGLPLVPKERAFLVVR